MNKVKELYENMPVGTEATYLPPAPKQFIPELDVLERDGKILIIKRNHEHLTGTRAIFSVTFKRLK